MASNAELQAEVERLDAENEDLAAERDRLAAELETAQANQKAVPNTNPQPVEPSFGLSEGQRADLELNGKTVSPFTGALQVGDGAKGSDVRVVSQDEFIKA